MKKTKSGSKGTPFARKFVIEWIDVLPETPPLYEFTLIPLRSSIIEVRSGNLLFSLT